MYIFAIAFTQLTKDSSLGTNHFPTVGESLYTLLVHGVFLDSLEYICTILEQDTLCLFLFFVFVMLSALTVMNMLIGVLCEVVSAVAEAEKDGIQVNGVTDKLYDVLSEVDADSNGFISKSEFMQILAHPGVAEALNEVNVDPVGIVDFADYIFDDASNKSDEISFDDFMKLVLSLRGSNHVTVKDIVDLRKHVLNALEKLEAEVLAAQKAQRASDAFQGLQPCSAGLNGGALQWRVEEARRLEEQVGRAEGLLVTLSSEVQQLSARLELQPQTYGQQPRPPTAQAAASRRHSRSSGPSAAAASRKRSVDTLLSNVPAPRRSSTLMGEREDRVHERLQLPHSLF